MSSSVSSLPKTREQWRKALDELPNTPERIPAFFFGHGSPMLAFPESEASRTPMLKHAGPKGPLSNFLRDFGPALLTKYNPKAIVVFSAHWETLGERLVTDYGDENPLYYDYYGFQPEMYRLKFKSRGDTAVSQRVVELFKESGLLARTSSKLEPRGPDGLGKNAPGLDHGVFVPFRLMFGETFMDIPIVEASLDGSLDPLKNWAVGQAVNKLREEGILVLSGGLMVHNLRDFSCFAEDTAQPIYHEFNKAVLDAVTVPDPAERKSAMVKLVEHPGFRLAHPRADHFVPLYVAAGAGEGSDVRVISAIYGAPTVAFGV
ncbi:extradiol aromatic ring-opening dioxygenase [Phanerochaete sordida]|uniref:Extradiol aromatic ring-opening dioxygenase n=1 Tax=Phanerochaete sordida TaxID=48140 RepID=A0A9P3G314_9APHY|nr:extradiol aromatic ring-opening dioxygenase [Phanerochaete sordida]